MRSLESDEEEQLNNNIGMCGDYGDENKTKDRSVVQKEIFRNAYFSNSSIQK